MSSAAAPGALARFLDGDVWHSFKASPMAITAALIAFAVVTETVFAWPGVGQLFIQSVQFSDIPVMAAYLLLIGLFFVLINLAVDLLYFAVDPRLRIEKPAGGH